MGECQKESHEAYLTIFSWINCVSNNKTRCLKIVVLHLEWQDTNLHCGLHTIEWRDYMQFHHQEQSDLKQQVTSCVGSHHWLSPCCAHAVPSLHHGLVSFSINAEDVSRGNPCFPQTSVCSRLCWQYTLQLWFHSNWHKNNLPHQPLTAGWNCWFNTAAQIRALSKRSQVRPGGRDQSAISPRPNGDRTRMF